MTSAKARQRQTPKQNQVAEVLRRQILDGTLKPKTRLPSQPEVARRFKVSAVTAHLAMTRLAREGFVFARKRHGTFVAEKPPHLNNYALVFWNDPVSQSGAQWSRYYTALTNEALTPQLQALLPRGRGYMLLLVQEGQRRGEIRADVPAPEIARMFQQFMFGTHVVWSLHPDPDLDGWLDQALDTIFDGVAARPRLQRKRK